MKKGVVGLVVVLAGVLSFSGVGFSSTLGADFFVPFAIKQDVANWKVGDSVTYSMDLGFFGTGELVKKVTSDEGEAIWVTTESKMPMGQQEVKTLHRKSDGKVLKMLVDGKEQAYDEPKIKILDQRPEEVTVPKGTFKSIYLKVRDETQEADIEVWINPIDIPVGGIVKTVIQKDFITATMEMTDFVKQ